MAKDKERSVNPAQQQRKLDKAKALKKGKAELQARRNEKLARRNPDRLQRQIDDLKALESSGDIKPREKAILDELERDLRAVRKAREALGEKAPQFGNKQYTNRRDGDKGISVLGKRRHDGERKSHQESSGSDTDDSVRRIPMPEDTPPPIPREFRRYHNNNLRNENSQNQSTQLPAVAVEAKTTYESAPQIRDLKKEAVGRFVPSVVRRKQDAARGVGGQLMEPEEMDRLEAEGYVARRTDNERQNADGKDGDEKMKEVEKDEVEVDEARRRLEEEEIRFQRELTMQTIQAEPQRQAQMRSRHVEIEEVEDEDA